MDERAIKWAQTHDWYIRCIGDAVIVRNRWTQNGKAYETTRRFDSFPALYRWAGY